MNVNHRRLLQLFAFLAAWAVVVVARLVQVQIVRHDYYVNKAQRQQERTLALSPVRGAILDSRKRVLAESVSAESIYADPQSIGDRRATARALAAALHEDARELDTKLASNSSFVWIARQLPLDVALEQGREGHAASRCAADHVSGRWRGAQPARRRQRRHPDHRLHRAVHRRARATEGSRQVPRLRRLRHRDGSPRRNDPGHGLMAHLRPQPFRRLRARILAES